MSTQPASSYCKIPVSSLRPGDVILSKSASLQGAVIDKMTNQAKKVPGYSHAALVITLDTDPELVKEFGGPETHLALFEADGNGVWPTYLMTTIDEVNREYIVLPYSVDKVAVYRHPMLAELSEEFVNEELKKFIDKNKGEYYSLMNRLVNTLRVRAGVKNILKKISSPIDRRKPLTNSDSGIFCSELVGLFYSYIGIDVFDDTTLPVEISPNRLANSKLVKVDLSITPVLEEIWVQLFDIATIGRDMHHPLCGLKSISRLLKEKVIDSRNKNIASIHNMVKNGVLNLENDIKTSSCLDENSEPYLLIRLALYELYGLSYDEQWIDDFSKRVVNEHYEYLEYLLDFSLDYLNKLKHIDAECENMNEFELIDSLAEITELEYRSLLCRFVHELRFCKFYREIPMHNNYAKGILENKNKLRKLIIEMYFKGKNEHKKKVHICNRQDQLYSSLNANKTHSG